MDSTVSVSKGCFAFKRKRKGKIPSSVHLSGNLWYQSYKKCMGSSEELLEVLEKKIFTEIFEGLLEYVKKCSSNPETSHTEIPAATLLTGVNMPDHTSLFATLSKSIQQQATPHVATLWARDCSSLKATVERMCSQFMLVPTSDDANDSQDCDNSSNEESDDEKQTKSKINRWHCNLQYLSSWYSTIAAKGNKKRKTNKLSEKFGGKAQSLVVIIPDFESFPAKVLQEFILLLKGYQYRVPFLLVLGVATAVSAVHRSLPHHVSSCLRMKVFHSRPSLAYLNEVLEKVFFLPDQPFHLGGKAFKLLLDVFLFHDFSVMGFVQGYKFCMMQHFHGKDWTVLTCSPEELPSAVKLLSKQDIESVRKLPSVRKHIETLCSKADQISWLKDDTFVKGEIVKLLTNIHKYVHSFFATLKCLNILTCDLPGAPLEKQLRSVYIIASTCDIVKSSELKECMTLLSFLSSDELESKLSEILVILHESLKNGATQMMDVIEKLEGLVAKFKTLWAPVPTTPTKNSQSPSRSPLKAVRSPLKSPSKLLMNVNSRSQLREKLKEMSTHDIKLSPFEKLRTEVLSFLLEEMFTPFLASPQTKPLHELVFFDNIAAVKSHIVGSPRQAMLRGLRDPHFYLDCDCCKLSDLGDILPTLPDVSIVYKLHLESGKLINMFDWLQSFLTIVDPSSVEEEQTEVDPKLQARFTRAVAELQFLGFIKSSNRKTDHVTRLTWC
ncbi:origin recognition complex subunit 3 [Thrips palmi]|uniref:Origin recognition complex subunit 3 n=1 Tax=Thrips palmi TaxID=161013 RepID=A0A6P9ADA6_THRPL|nr:origin recognition complex subunit 3 [Thrips palmi]